MTCTCTVNAFSFVFLRFYVSTVLHFPFLSGHGSAFDEFHQAEYNAEEPTAQPKFELSYEPINVKNLNAALSRSAVLLVSDPISTCMSVFGVSSSVPST